jgi:hypothetical protein
MDNNKDVSKNKEPFNPDSVFNQFLELNMMATELLHSNKKEAPEELKEINKNVIYSFK